MNDGSIGEVVRDPEWLPHGYDADGRTLTLVRVPPDERTRLKFLFDEQYGGNFPKLSFPGAAVADVVNAELDPADRAPSHFIFHTSFCGSTLLARALERPGIATSLREPAIFTNLANRVAQRSEQAAADRLELVLRLIERPLAADESVITKQSSFANRLIEPILRARQESHAVLLYSNLETYLISLLKRGLKGRIWGRKLFTILRGWSALELGLRPEELTELTDMQVASLAWLMQIHQFGVMAKTFGPRVMLIESSDMFADPTATLHRVSTLFDLGMTERDAAEIAAGPTFAKHSKFTDRDYSIEERQRDLETVGNANAEELTMVIKWNEAFAAHHGVLLRPSA